MNMVLFPIYAFPASISVVDCPKFNLAFALLPFTLLPMALTIMALL